MTRKAVELWRKSSNSTVSLFKLDLSPIRDLIDPCLLLRLHPLDLETCHQPPRHLHDAVPAGDGILVIDAEDLDALGHAHAVLVDPDGAGVPVS